MRGFYRYVTSVQFLRDREIGTRGAKQGVINNDNDDEKEYWFGRLGDETVHIDLVQSFWFNKRTVLSLNEK